MENFKIGDIVVDSINVIFKITEEIDNSYKGVTLKTKGSYSEVKSSCRLATSEEIAKVTGEFATGKMWDD